MRKAIPAIYCLFIYFVVLSLFYIQFDLGPLFLFGGVFLLSALNICNAIRLNKENDLDRLKFSTITTSFGLLPFYFISVFFFFIIGILASDYSNGVLTAVLLALGVNGFVRFSCALYMYFYIRKKGYPIVHKILSFLPIVSAVDLLCLLIRYREKKI